MIGTLETRHARSSFRTGWLAALAILGVAATGCRAPQQEQTGTAPGAVQANPNAAQGSTPDNPTNNSSSLELEVNLAQRQLHVFENGERVATHPVAIGQPDHPTPTGNYQIDQVVWNPEWIPPDSEWARDEEPAAPGDPDNPLGRAQLIFDRPYSIHGTRDTESLGQAESHGSIRVSNQVVTELARKAMQAGGADRSQDWIAEAQRDRTEERTVDLPNPIPLRIVEGSN